MPTLTSADLVTYAELDLSLYSNQLGNRQINAHKVLGDWSESTLSWSTQPDYNAIIEDYAIINGVAGNTFKWDVTNIVKEWFTTGNNNGLMLKNQDETVGYTEFFSSDTSSAYEAYRPMVALFYINNTGIESYWTYHSQDVGRAGTAYVNDYNGNYIFSHSDVSTNGNRMPVAISHFFNSNERVNNIGYGNGWRLSLYQTIVPQTINTVQYYVYMDEDGTKHYFKQSGNEYKDESGLDLTLVINGDNSYTLKDKKDNELIFKTKDASQTRYLDTIKDNNDNTATLGYNGTVLETVTDGAGRVIHLNYVNGLLDNIVDPAGRTTRYYYENNTLKTITYPDGKQSSYNYTPSNNMTDATNFDGYSVNIEYYTVMPWRVSKITEKHIDGTGGQALNIAYGNNATTFSDINGRKNIYQFNNSGNTISIRDDNGYAMFYQYDNGSNINKLKLESKLQRTVINALKDHNAEFGTGWTFYDSGTSTGSASYTTEDKYLGKQSIKITKSNTSGYHTSMQTLSADKGKTYTLSGYVKTNNISNTNNKGAQFYVAYQDSSGTWKKVESEFINGTNDWERIELVFTLPADSVSNDVHPKMTLTEETGTVYFDSLQFEEGHIANRYNIIENGDFKYNTEFWTNNYDTDINDTVITLADTDYPQNLNKNAFRINGVATKRKNVYQRIEISGKKNDVFTLGGWAKGESVSVNTSKNFMLDIGIERTDGTYQWQNIHFNDDYGDWQYSVNRILADSDYKSITIYMIYHHNANIAYFDGLQLYKEEFGQSYQYDDKGNLISTEDLAKQKSTFDYDTNNDLINSMDPKGNNYSYKYDDNHNIKTATSAENTVYKFKYDGQGNPNKVIIESVNNVLDNHNFETNVTWTPYNSGDSIGSADYDSNDSYLGNQSYKIMKSNVVGYHAVMQSVNLEKGKTYTFSGYVKADNLVTNNNKGAQIYVGYKDNTGAWVKKESAYITDTNGLWQRLSFSFTLPSNSVSNQVDPKFTLADASGTVYFDSFQIEEGDTASEYSKYLESHSTYTTNGNYTKTVKDPSGNIVSYNWNETKGVLDSLVDAKNTTTTYQYDANLDRLESVSKVVDGNTIANSYSYENDRIKTITHNGFNYTFGYDKLGNSTTVDVGSQNLITNNYEVNTSKLLNSVYGNNQKIGYDYDNLDRVTGVKYNDQLRYNYEYDASGNIGYHEDLVNGTNYRYIYDLSDRLAKVVDSNGDSVGYDYDSNNNTSKLIDKIGSSTYTTSYGYDKDNKPTLLTMPNGNTINYNYDSLGRLENSKVNIGSPIFTTNYDYHKGVEGSETTKLKSVDNNGASTSYTYDANGNIETITNNGQVIKYYYNELNELLREDNQTLNKTIVYAYDDGGNIQSKIEYPYTTEESPSNATKTYAYDYADTNWKDKLTSFDGKAITYDAIGNPLTYDGWNFTWEEGRQLQSLDNTQDDITFKYNDKGIRTEKTVNGVTTKYHLVGDKVTYETNGTDTIYYTYDSSNNLVSMNLNGVEYYYIRNGQGDIIGLFDSTGTEVVSYTYDSWGKLISIDGSLKDTVGVKNPYRYRGYRYDSESGLYYLQSRYYNPEFSRMLNADDTDILTEQNELLGKNLFAYCANNPVNHSDESGYWKLPNWAKIAIGVVAIGVAVVATVATGGAATPALLGALQVAGSSTAIGAGIGAVSGYISGGRKGALRGAIDGAADGFMWGGIGVAAETVASKVASKVIFNGNNGYGFKVGKKAEVLYKNPSKGGGTLVSVKKPKFRIDLDPIDGLHGHWGRGKAAKSIHRSLAPWDFGKPKKFW